MSKFDNYVLDGLEIPIPPKDFKPEPLTQAEKIEEYKFDRYDRILERERRKLLRKLNGDIIWEHEMEQGREDDRFCFEGSTGEDIEQDLFERLEGDSDFIDLEPGWDENLDYSELEKLDFALELHKETENLKKLKAWRDNGC